MKLSMRFILVAAVYGLAAMLMGIVMGAREDFSLAPVHAHLNLLGWVALTIYGVVYKLYPAMEQSRLASAQFYMVNAGVVLLIPALAILLLGNTAALPFLIVGELLTVASLAVFLVNIWRHRHLA